MKDYTSATIPLPNLSTSSPLPRAVLEADEQEGVAAGLLHWHPAQSLSRRKLNFKPRFLSLGSEQGIFLRGVSATPVKVVSLLPQGTV